MELNGNKLTVAIAAAVVVVAVVAGLLIYTMSIHSSGIIKTIGIGIYQNEQLTQPLESIDWGTVTPGSLYALEAWITNEKNTPVTLELAVTNWQPPEAANALTIDWSYQNGTVLNPGQKINVTFLLQVSEHPEPTTNFSNDIIVTATEKGENN